MKNIYTFIALMLLVTAATLWATLASAGGPWHDQYCDVEVTKVKVINEDGDVIQNLAEEKLVCEDGVKDFLHGMGIADTCEMFTWSMWLNGKEYLQRSIACKKIDGSGYEIVKGYHNIM